MCLFGTKLKPKKIEIDYDKLADAIVNAHNRIKEQEQIEQCEEQEKQEARWHTVIHYKNYPETRNIFLRGIREVRNAVAVLFSVVFFRKKYAKDDIVSFGLMRMAIVSTLGLIKVTLYLAALLLFRCVFYSFDDKTWIARSIYLLYSFVTFVFARMFRVAAFEADNPNDKQSIIGILSALSAFLALIVAIISLIVAVMK